MIGLQRPIQSKLLLSSSQDLPTLSFAAPQVPIGMSQGCLPSSNIRVSARCNQSRALFDRPFHPKRFRCSPCFFAAHSHLSHHSFIIALWPFSTPVPTARAKVEYWISLQDFSPPYAQLRGSTCIWPVRQRSKQPQTTFGLRLDFTFHEARRWREVRRWERRDGFCSGPASTCDRARLSD